MTSIQKFLGHKRLNSTMIYARVHNRTVAEDYYAAMDVVEKRLEVVPPEKEQNPKRQVNNDERTHLLKLATRLAEPELDVELRLDLVEKMCEILNHGTLPEGKQPVENERRPRGTTRVPSGCLSCLPLGTCSLVRGLHPVKIWLNVKSPDSSRAAA